MQLKLTRSQREGGVISTTVVFCLDARAQLTPQEQNSVTRYKLAKQVIYNSEASKRHLEKHQESLSTGHIARSFVSLAMVALNLNITIDSLQRGQHIECKSLDELLAAEDALMEACKNLKSYLDAAATFDGREVLIDFDTPEPTVVATAAAPAPMLISPPQSAPPVQPVPDAPEYVAAAASPTSSATYNNSQSMSGVDQWIERGMHWWQTASVGEKWFVGIGVVVILYIFYLIT